MKCTSCGTDVSGQNFCPACGNKVVTHQSAQFVPNQQNSQPMPNYNQPQANVGQQPYVPTPAQPQQTGYSYSQQPAQPVQPTQQYGQQQGYPQSQQYNPQSFQQPQQGYQQPQQGYAQPQQGTPYNPQYSQQNFNQQPQNFAPQQQQNVGNTDMNEPWKCALAYIPAGFWFGLLDKSNSGKYTANQGLWALICLVGAWTVIGILNAIIFAMSYKLWFLATLFTGAGSLFSLAIGIFCTIALIKAFQGDFMEFPVLGKNKLIK